MKSFRRLGAFALSIATFSAWCGIAGAGPLRPAFPVRLRPNVRAAAIPATITLASSLGSVKITTSPFRYAVTDATGRSVLVAAPAVSTVVPSSYVITSELPDVPASTQATKPVYAPFTYTVGTSILTDEPGGPFQGDLVEGAQSGVTYEATHVVAETHSAASATLTLATNETPARNVIFAITPRAGGFHFVASFDHADNVVGSAAGFVSPLGESFHGFGGRHNAIDEAGQAVTNYVEQEDQNPANVPGAPAAAMSNYLFPNGAAAAYYVQTQFISSAGYGFYLSRPELSEFRLDVDAPNEWLIDLFGAGLDYTVHIGTPGAVVAAQTALGGRQIQPPTWALYSEIDRNYPVEESSAADYYTKVQSDLAYLKTSPIPVTTYRIEGWAEITPAQLASTISALHALGIHALLYINPYGGYQIVPLTLAQAISAGYTTKTAAGTPYVFTDTTQPSSTLDFTNPATVTYWNGLVARMLDTGADGFMEDFGEQVMPDMYFHDGSTGITMHDEDPVLYHEITRAAVAKFLSTHAGRTFFSYARAGFTGSARYEYANFPGDETVDYGPASGLASLAPDMLNRSVGGAYGYTTDIGGYFNFNGSTTKELLLRWAAWSALTPFFRLHDDGLTGTEMPWDVDADTVAKYAALANLHDRFVPLIAQLWKQAASNGTPIVRPLWFADPGDAYGAKISQEWYLGPDVLVAPVIVQGATTNAVYLPAGCWQDQNTKREYQGRRTVTVAAPLGTLPYFFRCNSHPA